MARYKTYNYAQMKMVAVSYRSARFCRGRSSTR